MVRNLIILGAILVGVAVPTTVLHAAPTNIGWEIYFTGWALEDTGARCGTDCLAVVQQVQDGSWNANGSVSNNSSHCLGYDYNWGTADPWTGCWSPNGDTFHQSQFVPYTGHPGQWQMWLRHSCPTGGGYYYSPTHTWSPGWTGLCLGGGCHRDENFGTSQLYKPTGGCLPAS